MRFASERLKDDKEIVLEAVSKDGWGLKYVSDRLKDDKEVVLEAIKNNGLALAYASNRVQAEIIKKGKLTRKNKLKKARGAK